MINTFTDYDFVVGFCFAYGMSYMVVFSAARGVLDRPIRGSERWSHPLDTVARSQVPRVLLVHGIIPVLMDSQARQRRSIAFRIIHRPGRRIIRLRGLVQVILRVPGHLRAARLVS